MGIDNVGDIATRVSARNGFTFSGAAGVLNI